MKLKSLIPENRDVIYRCGWCGLPVAKDGSFLPFIKDYKDADEYIEKHKDAEVIHVDGECCPHGDENPDDWDRIHGEY